MELNKVRDGHGNLVKAQTSLRILDVLEKATRYSRLLKEINLNHADAARVLPANLRCVLAGLERRDEGRFEVAAWLNASILEFLLLARFPITVFDH